MIINPEQATFTTIPLDNIVSKLPVRRLSQKGVEAMEKSLAKYGFLDYRPITVDTLGENTYRLIDGNHRVEAAKNLGIASAPTLVFKETLQDNVAYKRYFTINEAAYIRANEPIMDSDRIRRSAVVKQAVLEKAHHTCIICGLHLQPPKGNFIQPHHLIPLSINGEDSVENCIAVCPNHHMILHSILGDINELNNKLWAYYQQALPVQEVKQIKRILAAVGVA